MARHIFSVTISTSDEREDAEDRLALVLAETLYLHFGPERWELRAGDKEYQYDHLAQDGHHEGHSQALTVKKRTWSRGLPEDRK